MLNLIRRHKQIAGIFLLPVLLLVWLSFSCQDCFASSMTEKAQQDHAAMDCCPMGSQTGQHDHQDMSDCDNMYLQNQPALSAEATTQLGDMQMLLLPVAEMRFEASYPELIPPFIRTLPEPFSDRLFSSYRILLI